ncbi:hypothetical protein Dimus_026666 [Dionaea muscipula]
MMKHSRLPEELNTGEMKPFQRFIHFLVMKNVIPRFGKRDTSSFMARRLVNLPRVMMRHMSYVISMKDHELPYGDWLTLVFEAFGVPLVIKKGEEPKKYDFFEDTFLTMCKLTRENGICRGRRTGDETPATRRSELHLRLGEKEQDTCGVDPSCPTGRLPEAEFLKFQAEFERKRANRFHDDLEKAKAENARLLALLHQAQTKPHP